jgi:nucleotide-binding universal stress UspA family protein
MLRNILLLVEETDSARVAREVAFDIAAQGDCNLTALRITESGPDRDGDDIVRSPHMLIVEELAEHVQGSGPPRRPRKAPAFDAPRPAPNLVYREQALPGPKYPVLCRESAHNDLTVIGRDGNFAEHWTQDAKEIINLMLEYQPRPLIIAPSRHRPGRDVLVAYDGSPGAARAIQLFVLLGLTRDRDIHVLSADRKKDVARSRVDTIAAYLKNHHVGTMPHAVTSRADAGEILMEKLDETRASLVVAGACGASAWKRNVFGSVSDYLIRHCPVPLFACR